MGPLSRNAAMLLHRCHAPLVETSWIAWRLDLMRPFGIGSHMSDNDPEEIEKAIKRQKMGKSKCMSSENAPGWEEKLASDSEAFIKADRSKTSDMKTLQDETVECLESEEKDNASKTSQD